MAHSDVLVRLKLRLLDWMAESEDVLPMPMRRGHNDHSPRDLVPVHGRAMEAEEQHWHLRNLKDLYRDWKLIEDGVLR